MAPRSCSHSKLARPGLRAAGCVVFSTLALLLGAAPAGSVVIDDGLQNGNRTPPADDPGFDRVGIAGDKRLNAVFIGEGWWMTTFHGGCPGYVDDWRGVRHVVPGWENGGWTDLSVRGTWCRRVGFKAPAEEFCTTGACVPYSYPDVRLVRTRTWPSGFDRAILSSSLRSAGDEVVVIGADKDTAAVLEAPPGYALSGRRDHMRWGTNVVHQYFQQIGAVEGAGCNGSDSIVENDCFSWSFEIRFDPFVSANEGVLSSSGSGSPAFYKNGSQWEIAGIGQTSACARPECVYYATSGFVDLGGHPQLRADVEALLDSDLDRDFVLSDGDNCTEVANPDQLDADLDGYGNACDADLSQDGMVGLADYLALASAFGAATGDSRWNPAADLNGNGVVGISDFIDLVGLWGRPVGPSGLACAGTPPCPGP